MSAYRDAVGRGLDLGREVEAAGLRCGTCGSGSCAVAHDVWYRERVVDLSTGDVFEKLPIQRVQFCDGGTRSLMPAELWRGRFTVSSVLETTSRVLRDGVEAAYDWTWAAGRGEQVVSQRTLGRWREVVRKRLVGSALAWLGPHLGFAWSGVQDAAPQLDTLLDQMTGTVLSAFRGSFGHSVLDKPKRPGSRARSIRRRVPGRLAPTSPHKTPFSIRPRGTWSRLRRRGPPPADPEEEA